jgi:glycosyltransferase involved in cell wall biosynthesis
LACVGRLVPSKGTDVVLEAVARARSETARPVRLTLVGNPVFSHPDYIAELDAILDREDLRDVVTILADVDDDGLWRCYEEADVVVSASFHEGLCVPVIEGYLAGCRVIGTTAGNLPFIVQPPDVVVEPGDVDALARAIVSLDRELVGPHQPRHDAARELCLRYGRDAARKEMQRALRDRVTTSGAPR